MMKEVDLFLEKQWDQESPLLLGYSGGPDSKALLYALLEAGCKTLHLAHVDHGWRQESEGEAMELQREAERLGLPFHITRLSGPWKGNGEAIAREARLSFFQTLFKKIPFQALILAHHADDVAETVLKRVLEGAHLPFLGGMQSIAILKEMVVWRPLLSLERREIVAFLQERSLKALVDPTNFNPSYLRARMRTQILPELSGWFGKEISQNLSLLSQRARELKLYLDDQTKSLLPSRGPWGLFGSLSDLKRVEARYILQKWANVEGVRLGRSVLELMLDAAFSKIPNRSFSPRILIDRGDVFFLSKAFPLSGTEPFLLKPGHFTWGDWTVDVTVSKTGGEEKNIRSTWKEVWGGRFTGFVPEGWLMMPLKGGPLRRIWNEKKVPAFLRYQIPIVWRETGAPMEFLSGKILPETNPAFKLTLSLDFGQKIL